MSTLSRNTEPDSPETADDRELLSQLLRQSGPRSILAQRRVYDHYAPMFFAFLRRRNVPERGRQDIVQETLVSAFSSIDEVLAAHNPRSYMWTILLRKHCDWFRQNYRKVEHGVDAQGRKRLIWIERESLEADRQSTADDATDWYDLDEDAAVDGGPQSQAEQHDLRECFARASRVFLELHPKRAVFIELHVEAQMSDREIAEAIGRTTHATAQFLSQCRTKFLELLKRLCGPDAIVATATT